MTLDLRLSIGRLRRSARRAAPASSLFADTGVARELRAHRARTAMKYGIAGAALGAIGGLIAFAPAAWLASTVASVAGDRLLLADARGTVWKGSAVVVLTGGAGSRDATALPGRLDWTLDLEGLAFRLVARHACCLFGPTALQVRPGLGRLTMTLPAAPAGIGQWPAAWLSGLGTPWNTLQLGGTLRLATPGARLEIVQGRWVLDGQVSLEMSHIASRISTLDELGSYRAVIAGSAAGQAPASLSVTTTGGALQVSGQGQWSGSKLRFQGEAIAAEGAEPALNNLLNIIGRRQGARSVISIG